jgi:hypothetical protein
MKVILTYRGAQETVEGRRDRSRSAPRPLTKAYYVDVRTLTEDNVNVHAVRKSLAETSPTYALSVNRLLLWGPKGKVLRVESE